MNRAELESRYERAVHRMQSAMAYDVEQKVAEGRAGECASIKRYLKHLRVGINNAMAEQGALAKLLTAKGVITEEEYFEAIVRGAEEEADLREKEVRQTYNLPESVTFH